MRQLFAVGRISPQEPRRLARMCSWCSRWFSEADRKLRLEGAPITHGMCRECLRKNTPPEAA